MPTGRKVSKTIVGSASCARSYCPPEARRPDRSSVRLPPCHFHFGRRQITDNVIFGDFVDNDFVRLAGFGDIELHGLVDGTVPLLERLVICLELDGESLPLGIRLL